MNAIPKSIDEAAAELANDGCNSHQARWTCPKAVVLGLCVTVAIAAAVGTAHMQVATPAMMMDNALVGFAQAKESPQDGSCPVGYAWQSGNLKKKFNCHGTKVKGHCILPKHEAFKACSQIPACQGVSETSNSGWLKAYPNRYTLAGGLPVANREWASCVKSSPQGYLCPSDYAWRSGKPNKKFNCYGTKVKGHCILPKHEAFKACSQIPACQGVSETSHSGWLKAYPNSYSLAGGLLVANREWASCVKLSPQGYLCPSDYAWQSGNLKKKFNCHGTKVKGHCILPKHKAFLVCSQTPACQGVSETSNSGWLKAYPNSYTLAGGLPVANSEWASCVKPSPQGGLCAPGYALQLGIMNKDFECPGSKVKGSCIIPKHEAFSVCSHTPACQGVSETSNLMEEKAYPHTYQLAGGFVVAKPKWMTCVKVKFTAGENSVIN